MLVIDSVTVTQRLQKARWQRDGNGNEGNDGNKDNDNGWHNGNGQRHGNTTAMAAMGGTTAHNW